MPERDIPRFRARGEQIELVVAETCRIAGSFEFLRHTEGVCIIANGIRSATGHATKCHDKVCAAEDFLAEARSALRRCEGEESLGSAAQAAVADRATALGARPAEPGGTGGIGHGRRLDDRQIDQRRARVVAHAERPQVVLAEIEHADDVRRQRQDDVGLLRLLAVVREEAPDDREVAQARNPSSDRPLVVANQAGEQVGLAVAAAGWPW